MKITDALLAEHVVFHNLFDHVERTLPGLRTLAEVRTMAAMMESMMLLHSEAEDELLMKPLEPSFCQLGQEENFHAEHDDIERMLREVQQSRAVAKAKKLLTEVVLASRKHFDKEERIVFPLAEKQLSGRSQEMLGKRWAKQRKVTVD